MATPATWRDPSVTWRSPFYSWRGQRIAGHGDLRESVFSVVHDPRHVVRIVQQAAVATISTT